MPTIHILWPVEQWIWIIVYEFDLKMNILACSFKQSIEQQMRIHKEARKSLSGKYFQLYSTIPTYWVELKLDINEQNCEKCEIITKENDERLKKWIDDIEKYINIETEKIKKRKCQIM